MGIFNDGELKPYPASAYSSLPDPYRLEVPVGLWRPVGLEYIGPIAIDWMRLKPQFEAGDGRLEVEARLRNLDGRQMDGQVELVVSSAVEGAAPLRLHREVRLGGGMELTVSMRLALPAARRQIQPRADEFRITRPRVRVPGDQVGHRGAPLEFRGERPADVPARRLLCACIPSRRAHA